MPIYPYTAEDAEGERQDGVIEAPTRERAVQELRSSGWRPLRVDVPAAGCDHHVPDVQTDPC